MLNLGTGVTIACFHWKGTEDDSIHLLIKTVTSLTIQGEALINWAEGPLAPEAFWICRADMKDDTTSIQQIQTPKGFALITYVLSRVCGRVFRCKILTMDFVNVWILKMIVQKLAEAPAVRYLLVK